MHYFLPIYLTAAYVTNSNVWRYFPPVHPAAGVYLTNSDVGWYFPFFSSWRTRDKFKGTAYIFLYLFTWPLGYTWQILLYCIFSTHLFGRSGKCDKFYSAALFSTHFLFLLAYTRQILMYCIIFYPFTWWLVYTWQILIYCIIFYPLTWPLAYTRQNLEYGVISFHSFLCSYRTKGSYWLISFSHFHFTLTWHRLMDP